MPIQIETLSLISAIQGAILATMLWLGIQGEAGTARTSLHLRALALAVEAGGWVALTLHAKLSPAQLLLGGNALNLIALGMSVQALRLLLGEPMRWASILAIGLLGWLGVAWFGVIGPDYRYRVLWGSVAIALYMFSNIEALTSGFRWRFSRARVVLLLLCVMSVLLLVWRNGELWFGQHLPHAVSAPTPANVYYILLSGMQPLFASIGFLLLYNEILQKNLHRLARIDSLTGVSNRLAIDEVLGRLLARSAREQKPLAVLMLDADHFKSVNDRFGHAGGDRVLRELVSNIGASLRHQDVMGRVGGEEFVVLAPTTNLSEARQLGERIRLMVEGAPLLIDGELLQLTVSVGVSVALPAGDDAAAVLRRADQALYAAKLDGRNRVKSITADGSMAVLQG
jgi:diguanylate cyclase (GGDEF)-like protein